MVDGPEPIHDPRVTPSPTAPQYGEGKPGLGSGEEAEPQKPFSLKPEDAAEGPAEAAKSDAPSPMELAGEGHGPQMKPEELSATIEKLQDQLKNASKSLSNPEVRGKLTPEHHAALSKLIDKMNPDVRATAQHSGQEPQILKQGKDENVLSWVTRWVDGAQQTMGGALKYLSKAKHPDIASFMKLQYSVQRAQQRGELFASIVGSSVSGIKTIMSTQLG